MRKKAVLKLRKFKILKRAVGHNRKLYFLGWSSSTTYKSTNIYKSIQSLPLGKLDGSN